MAEIDQGGPRYLPADQVQAHLDELASGTTLFNLAVAELLARVEVLPAEQRNQRFLKTLLVSIVQARGRQLLVSATAQNHALLWAQLVLEMDVDPDTPLA